MHKLKLPVVLNASKALNTAEATHRAGSPGHAVPPLDGQVAWQAAVKHLAVPLRVQRLSEALQVCGFPTSPDVAAAAEQVGEVIRHRG